MKDSKKTRYFIYMDCSKRIKTSIAISNVTPAEAAEYIGNFEFAYQEVSWIRYLLFKWFKSR